MNRFLRWVCDAEPNNTWSGAKHKGKSRCRLVPEQPRRRHHLPRPRTNHSLSDHLPKPAQRPARLLTRDLEEVVIRTLKSYDLHGARREGMTGIWIETRKICALGVAVKSWVTYHGLSPSM